MNESKETTSTSEKRQIYYNKIIVTNRKALVRKYGNSGAKTITKALLALITADKNRGIKTKVVCLDVKADMKKTGFRSPIVTNTSDPHQNKDSIDAVFKYYKPQYLMILGAPDVVPHQDLSNPAYSPGGDDDVNAWGDLPYACDASYSKDPAKFIGPTRVVGRLPDLFGAKEPSYLISLLKTATNYSKRPPHNYSTYFGLSAEVWRGSTSLSLNNIFGNDNKMLLAPPSGPNYPNGELKNRMHFINCHGAPATPEFYGQHGGNYPVSLSTQSIGGQILEGTVAAVECCYGAELYDSVTLAIDIPICQSYLHQGGYGYFGSTTIAYGPADENAQADLISQYFLLNILDGDSIGLAALKARHQFVQNTAQMDPVDLKTLAQYCLLGDPSIHPIAPRFVTKVPVKTAIADAESFFRTEIRDKLKLAGAFLSTAIPTASQKSPNGKISPTTKTVLQNIAKLAGLSEKQGFSAFAVTGGAPVSETGFKLTAIPSRYHVAIGKPEGEVTEKVKLGIAVVAKEVNGRIVGYRIYHQR